MSNLVEILKKIYDKFFHIIVKSFESNENYLKFIWLTFAYLKKKILKRKNDYELSLSLLCSIFEIFRIDLKTQIMKKDSNIEISLGLGNYESYYREVFSDRNSKMNTSIFKETKNFLKEEFTSLRLKDEKDNFFFLSNSNSFIKNNEIYKSLESAYYDILISDEIDDLKIFENNCIEKKLKSKVINNLLDKNFSLSKPKYSTNKNGINCHKNSFDILESQSPLQNKIVSNQKLDIDLFFKDVSEFTFLDISYLFQKFSYFSIKNKTFKYEKLFNEFEKKFFCSILELINEKIDLNYENHKNLFLKLADELLQQEQTKFEEKEFNLILNDESFHFNFLILTFFIYLNFVLIDRNSVLDELCLNYFTRLNKFEYFGLINIFKIISNLSKIELPFNINITIKKFQKGLISFVLWKCDYFIFENQINSTDEGNIEIKKICDKVLLYTVSVIYKISNCFNIEAKLREKFWNFMKNIFTSQIYLLKDQYLDCVIIHVIYYVIYSNLTENNSKSKNLLSNLSNKYFEIKNSLIFKNVFLENLRKFETNGFLETLNRVYMSLDDHYLKNKTTSRNEYQFLSKYLDYEMSTIIPCLQEDFNVIYSISPISNKIMQNQNISFNKSNDNSVDYLGNKRIRQLNSPLSPNTLTFSPYSRKSSFTIKNISAFKNLNTVLLSTQKDKII